jgi:diguanylate cyclase (GGDEF)-like protein/PAS domain S-box-containing protein
MQILNDPELRYRRLFDTAQDGILILDARTGTIADVNPYLTEMLGYSREEFVEKKLWEVGAFKDIEASQNAFEVLQENEAVRYEDLPLKTKDGRIVEVEFVRNVYLVGDEKVVQCNVRDSTERKQALINKTRRAENSIWDKLTGLYNHSYMEETLARELLRASRKQLSLGVIMLDVDDFKLYYGSLGRAAGDVILRELGSLLLKHVRGDDITCHYGDDEFIIVLPDASRKITWERAELICEHAKQSRFEFNEQVLQAVTLSIGVAVFPDDGSSSTTLLMAADQALYRAKREGRNRVAVAK